ncbi:hypothetical protein PIB30_057219 [Stylosanthes scabra]|uniref:Uncharacterized protein n=1 Tax=Stylosanthes scabra TaxID=79078 RepID=A0ABU6YJS2_9FABA|nr:hypothetical protein [Stylosanthes scabra]
MIGIARKIPRKFITRKLSPKASSSRVGAISHKDLNYPQVYKQGASLPQGTHSLTLLTLFDLESNNLISGLLGLFTSISTPFSTIVLGYAIELVTEGTSSYLKYRDLAPHSKSFGQLLREPTLTEVKLKKESVVWV